MLASAVVLTPRWVRPLDTDANGMLVLDDGLQAIVSTRAAGLVGVAKPFTEDGIDVLSVIAAPGIPAPDVWRGVEEVVERLESGRLWNHDFPGDGVTQGHAWTVGDAQESFVASDAPPDGTEMWSSHLPRWAARSQLDLREAPGVDDVVASIAARLPEPLVSACVQAARADYDENGFSAAAVTAMGLAAGWPQLVERNIRRVDITFDRPHALVAIARGGLWEGVPLFHAWVTPVID